MGKLSFETYLRTLNYAGYDLVAVPRPRHYYYYNPYPVYTPILPSIGYNIPGAHAYATSYYPTYFHVPYR